MKKPTGKAAKIWLIFIGLIISAVFMTCTVSAQNILPIEVIGPSGFVYNETVNIPNGSTADSLWMEVYSHGYRQSEDYKMAVRINNGTWITLTNDNSVCDFPYKGYNCVGGAIETIGISFAIAGVVDGDNDIDFRYNQSDGNSSGYHVLRYNVKSNGTHLIPENTFTTYDFSTEVHNPAHIADGKTLWEQTGITVSDIDSTPMTKTSCQTCHDDEGADLKMFSFTKNSIITRSVFHGMSYADGEKIAAFVNSNQEERCAWPWDPPHQPAPGLDSGTGEEWMCGGGLKAVRKLQSDIKPYYDAQIDTLRAIYGTDISRGYFNMREMPLTHQLPTISRWWGMHSPTEDPSGNFLASDAYDCWTNTLPAYLEAGTIANDLNYGSVSRQFSLCQTKNNNLTFPDDSLGTIRKSSFRKWRLMKGAFLMLKYNLFDKCEDAYPMVPGDPRQRGEKLCYPSLHSLMFTIAAHRLDSNEVNWPDIKRNNEHFSFLWYQLAVIVNSGSRLTSEQDHIDWKYQQAHVPHSIRKGGGGVYNFPNYVTHAASWLKLLQVNNKDLCQGSVNQNYNQYSKALYGNRPFNMGQCAFGPENDMNYNYSFGARTVNPSQTQLFMDVNDSGVPQPGSTIRHPSVLEIKELYEPLIDAYLTRLEEFQPTDWYCRAYLNTNNPGNHCFTPEEYVPDLVAGGYYLRQKEYAKQWYKLVAQYWPNLGVKYSILKRFATVADLHVPNANPTFSEIVGDPPSVPNAINLSAPADNAVGLLPTVSFSWLSDPNATEYELQYDDSGVSMPSPVSLTVSGTSRSIIFQSNDTNQYHWRVRGKNAGGDGNWSSVRNFTLAGNDAWSFPFPDKGEFVEGPNEVMVSDTSATIAHTVAFFGPLADGETFSGVTDSTVRINKFFDNGVSLLVADTSSAYTETFDSIELRNTGTRLVAVISDNASGIDSSWTITYYNPNSPRAFCLKHTRVGNVVTPEWANVTTGSGCGTFQTVKRADDSVLTKTFTTPIAGIKAKATAPPVRGYLRNVQKN